MNNRLFLLGYFFILLSRVRDRYFYSKENFSTASWRIPSTRRTSYWLLCDPPSIVFDFNTNRKCLNCGAIHVGNESLFVFPLGVSDSISSQRDLSNTLAMSEVIWNCATCADCECERRFTFRQTKDILILQLNLFADDSVGDWIFLMELSWLSLN